MKSITDGAFRLAEGYDVEESGSLHEWVARSNPDALLLRRRTPSRNAEA